MYLLSLQPRHWSRALTLSHAIAHHLQVHTEHTNIHKLASCKQKVAFSAEAFVKKISIAKGSLGPTKILLHAKLDAQDVHTTGIEQGAK